MTIIIAYKFRPDGVYESETELDVSDPATAAIPNGMTTVSPYPIPKNHYAVIRGGQWFYNQGDEPPYPSSEEIQSANKQQAEILLQNTDWAATVDISNPQYSNPYLGNQDDFLAYRSQVRQVAVNPPSTMAAFPEKPNEVWVNA